MMRVSRTVRAGRVLLTACVLWCGSQPAGAQSAPNAGSQQRLQRDLQRIPAADRASTIDLKSGTAAQANTDATDNTQTVRVERFVFVGNARISQTELAGALRDFAGRELTLSEVRRAADLATAVYAAQGYNLARVVLPPQDINAGAVTLLVFEGFLEAGGLELVDFTEGRSDLDYIQSIFQRQIDFSQPVRRREYERALRLVENLPGVTTRSWLYPGTQVGTARLRVHLQQVAQFRSVANVDNYGARATGANRLSVVSVSENVMGSHETGRFEFTTSGSGNGFVGAGGKLPVGTDGWTVGLSGDYLRYDLMAPFDFNGEHGSASHVRLGATYPLQLLRDVSWTAITSLNNIRQTDLADSFAPLKRRVNFLGLALLGELAPPEGGAATTTIRVSLSTGSTRITAGTDSGETDGRFALIDAEILHLVALSPSLTLTSQLRLQTASRNLNGYFKCGVGGPYSSRGYPTGQVSADRCAVFNNEVFYQLGPRWRTSAFLELARTTDNIRDVLVDGNATNKLASVGISASVRFGKAGVISAAAGHQLTRAREHEVRGFDADDRSGRNRFWLQGTLQF